MLHIYMVWLGFAKTHTYPVWGMTTLRPFRSPPAAPVPVLSHWSITAIENAQSGDLEYRLTQLVGCNNFEFRNNLSGVTFIQLHTLGLDRGSEAQLS